MTNSERPNEDDSGANNDPGTRIYRLHNRRRPCDQCRSRKVRCQADGGKPPCRRCAQTQTTCTFERQPRRTTRQNRTTSLSSGAQSPSSHRDSQADALNLNNSFNTEHDIGDQYQPPSNSGTAIHGASPHVFPPESELAYHRAPTLDGVTSPTQLQFSQSLDDIHGQTPILLGSSSESDPWLLRHCQFDEYGLRSFYGLQFRNIGGVPNRQKIPVHFIVTPSAMTETGSLRAKLNELIPVSWGIRLVKLFYKHVYPMMPIISSTYFSQELLSDPFPSHDALDHVPYQLLASIYGIALPFARNDEHLSIADMHNQLPRAAVWRIVYDSLQEQLHRPRLSVLQAGLFYLHSITQDHQALVTAPDAFKWSWLGTLVGIAHNLGLHLETRMCAIPTEEKQIRARLCSLKASQKLSEDLSLSIQTAHPIFEQLGLWRASVLAPESPWITSNNSILNYEGSYPATIFVAHATLVTYIWRALLRPIVPSAAPPLILDGQLGEGSLNTELQSHAIENLDWDLPDLSHLELPLRNSADGSGSHDTTIQNLHQSCLAWAISLSNLAKHLSPARFHEFWYSWSNVCFAVMSSFSMVVLIQSPTQEAAMRSKEMLLTWRHIVRDQSKISQLLLLALARIDGYFAAGLPDVFSLPPHVKAVI
ncbi:hypothetical protein NCS55_01480200 [Fusarium keratoplasticum]|nr:hypothetical protein NCS55_01480200 [Fusarium keratoplasticum]